MRSRYKAWAKPYLESHPEVLVKADQYSFINDVELEIGAGKGGFLIKKASNNLELNFIGIERDISCCGVIAKKLVENQITNGKLIYGNAENIIINFKEKSINNIYLNFSDPWPKKKHHRRRLTTENFLKQYFRILKDDGLIIMKTDNEDLFNFSKELFLTNSFELLYNTNDYKSVEPGDETTEYEDSFRAEGKPIYRLKARKIL